MNCRIRRAMSFKRQILVERVSLAPQTPPASSLRRRGSLLRRLRRLPNPLPHCSWNQRRAPLSCTGSLFKRSSSSRSPDPATEVARGRGFRCLHQHSPGIRPDLPSSLGGPPTRRVRGGCHPNHRTTFPVPARCSLRCPVPGSRRRLRLRMFAMLGEARCASVRRHMASRAHGSGTGPKPPPGGHDGSSCRSLAESDKLEARRRWSSSSKRRPGNPARPQPAGLSSL